MPLPSRTQRQRSQPRAASALAVLARRLATVLLKGGVLLRAASALATLVKRPIRRQLRPARQLRLRLRRPRPSLPARASALPPPRQRHRRGGDEAAADAKDARARSRQNRIRPILVLQADRAKEHAAAHGSQGTGAGQVARRQGQRKERHGKGGYERVWSSVVQGSGAC